jgi:hypothetical protein
MTCTWNECRATSATRQNLSDPQYCRGGPEAAAKVAEWMRLCECSHVQVEHDIADPRTKRAGQRTACLTTEQSGKCPCLLYSQV